MFPLIDWDHLNVIVVCDRGDQRIIRTNSKDAPQIAVQYHGAIFSHDPQTNELQLIHLPCDCQVEQN